ncbi:MAG: RHS repeat-associated core domain-containing protein, partial [Longimicrobiaceae bacterium]
RPDRTNSTIRARYSAAYPFRLVPIVDSFLPHNEVSTKTGQLQLAYDSQDALVRMGAAGDNAWRLFVYTADGERVWTIVGGFQVLHVRGLGNEVLRTYTRGMAAGAWETPWDWSDDTIWRGSQRLASVSTTGYANRTHYHLDHLGTPRLHTNGSGDLKRRLHVYPFGRETPETSSPSVHFTGHERDNLGTVDGANDMDYMHARFYSPQMGRLFSVDPYGGNPFNPQSWNRYTYTQNNPLRYVDPTGEFQAPSQIAASLEQKIDELEQFVSSLLPTDIGGIMLDTQLGVAADMSRAMADVLRLGEATGTAIGEGAGAVETTLSIGGDALRAMAIAAPATGVVRGTAARGGAQVVQRAMSSAELTATRATGLLRGGRGGRHFVSDAVNSNALRARQRLALAQTPDVRVTFSVPAGRFSAPRRIPPHGGMPGGGMERVAEGQIPVQILDVLKY